MMTIRSIEQLIQVFSQFRDNFRRGRPLHSSYHDAVRAVAKNYSVTYQTIGDGCRRRLKLDNINQLFNMLAAWMGGDPKKLKHQLLQSSELAAHDLIERFFIDSTVPAAEQTANVQRPASEEFEIFSFRILKQEARLARALAELEGLSVEELMTKLLSSSVRSRMKILAKDFINETPK